MRDEDFEEEWEWEKIEGEWEENEEWKEFGEFGVCREGYHEEYDYYAEENIEPRKIWNSLSSEERIQQINEAVRYREEMRRAFLEHCFRLEK
ncbi:MAG: hypothetical protein A2039_05170 [Candidatus Melainabacteria bacterium GWA2_34_9]|nr:MAG: hypothetical protein A2039_05170 [Candidatus Melainabacteria bacterium GWA2_34_9]